ncbi:MAG: orotidine-5'-phosphate decarboxylase [Prolixibacteraceae bacterium]|nr:orotidine-5'-phosphate decarboxylase [Prolixibacteraceae bacterium]
MNQQQLFEQIKEKRSFLCVGLDTDILKIPGHLLNESDPVFSFNKEIIDATAEFSVAFKPNLAFYESMGRKGWGSLERTVEYVKSNYPGIFLIADAKRGDIGNTAGMYARAFLENMKFDAITIVPYMGHDSVMPFLNYRDKWVILLALSSNKGASDFQFRKDEVTGNFLYEDVIKVSQSWGTTENMMYVVGATKSEKLKEIRRIAPDNFLLVPGIGAQGGSLHDVAVNGMNSRCGLLVNSSRGIIYASSGTDFAARAAEEAGKIRHEMEDLLRMNNLV